VVPIAVKFAGNAIGSPKADPKKFRKISKTELKRCPTGCFHISPPSVANCLQVVLEPGGSISYPNARCREQVAASGGPGFEGGAGARHTDKFSWHTDCAPTGRWLPLIAVEFVE
jgi:hypothetical protein